MSESGGSYVCSLTNLDTKYAGCSVRFEARISQSAGQVSSAWVSSGDVVFPRVKLEAPSASLANVNETLAVSYGPMNRLINTAEWDAQLTALSWDEVADADRYRIELTDKDDNSTTVTVDMSGNLPEIIVNGQNTFAVAGDDWYTVKQGSAVNGRYSLTNGSIRYYSYQPDTMLQVKDGTFTLKLPNIFSVVTHENQTLQLTNGIQISRVTVIADSKSDRYTESDPAERRFLVTKGGGRHEADTSGMEHPAAQQAKRCFADRSTLCCRRPDRAFAQYRVFLIHAALAGQPQDRQGNAVISWRSPLHRCWTANCRNTKQ